MQLNLTIDEQTRIDELAKKQTDAEMRGTRKADRPKVMLYRIIALGLAAAESKAGGS